MYNDTVTLSTIIFLNARKMFKGEGLHWYKKEFILHNHTFWLVSKFLSSWSKLYTNTSKTINYCDETLVMHEHYTDFQFYYQYLKLISNWLGLWWHSVNNKSFTYLASAAYNVSSHKQQLATETHLVSLIKQSLNPNYTVHKENFQGKKCELQKCQKQFHVYYKQPIEIHVL